MGVFALLVVLFAALVIASSAVGVPKTLPGVALDWRLLFHIERATAALGAVGAVLLVLWQSAHNQWPSKLGIATATLEYNQAVGETADAIRLLREAVADQEGRISALQAQVAGQLPRASSTGLTEGREADDNL